MTNPQKKGFSIEDQLADFTDRILSDDPRKQDEATFAPDPELRALEQTARRLKAAFTAGEPDRVVIQRMHNGIIEKWHHQGNFNAKMLWYRLTHRPGRSGQKWTSGQSRRRISIAISLATLLVILLLAIPFLNSSGTGQPGASGQNPSSFILIALGGLILLVMWLYRRRP